MAFFTVESADNQNIRAIAKLRQKKYRKIEQKYIAEGLNAVEEIIKADKAEEFVVTKSFFEENSTLTKILENKKCFIVTEKIFALLAETQTPQGILCTVKIPDDKKIDKKRYIYLDNVSDPGNVGTIIRSAHAFGFSGVLLSPTSVDVYSGKVVRSAMSSNLYIDILKDVTKDTLLSLKYDGYKIISTALSDNSRSLYETDFGEKSIFVIGNEASGVSDEIIAESDETVIIPMPGGAESLNASVAASLVMAEAARRDLVKGK